MTQTMHTHHIRRAGSGLRRILCTAAAAALAANMATATPSMAGGESITPADEPLGDLMTHSDDTSTQSQSIGDWGYWGTCSNGWTLVTWERFGALYYCHWVKQCSNYTRVAMTTKSWFTCFCPLTKPNCSKNSGGATGVGQ